MTYKNAQYCTQLKDLETQFSDRIKNLTFLWILNSCVKSVKIQHFLIHFQNDSLILGKIEMIKFQQKSLQNWYMEMEDGKYLKNKYST